MHQIPGVCIYVFMEGWIRPRYYDYILKRDGSLEEFEKTGLVEDGLFMLVMEPGETVPTEGQQATINTLIEVFGKENVYLYFPK